VIVVACCHADPDFRYEHLAVADEDDAAEADKHRVGRRARRGRRDVARRNPEQRRRENGGIEQRSQHTAHVRSP
jgi:hypothetical protein